MIDFIKKMSEQFDFRKQSDKEQKWAKGLEATKNAARLVALGAYIAGHPELGESLLEGGQLSKEGTLPKGERAGALRKAGSNISGKVAGAAAKHKYKVGGGKAAAIGGAVSSALKGEGVSGIAKGAVSWYLLYIAFGALVTVVGFIPGLIYLDFHYIMSKFGSKIFGEMSLWQKISLAFANVVGFMIVFVFLVIVPVAVCNVGPLGGDFGKIGSTVAYYMGIIPVDICAKLSFNVGTQAGSGIVGKLDIVLTSAYRPGSIVTRTGKLSAHSRGEAVDIALLNPTALQYSSDPRVARLVQIAQSVGFTDPAGDTLDEYMNPTEGASGGHVHVEFNTQPNGKTYCDDTVVKNPPTDLIAIPPSIPRSGSSDWRLRQCMLSKVQAIFNAVAAASTASSPPTTTP